LLGVYCRGLLSNLPRKTAEPIALAAGTAVRTLQEFLKDHAWSYREARTTLQEHVATTLPTLPADDLGSVGLVDETGTVKKGTKPGFLRGLDERAHVYVGEVPKSFRAYTARPRLREGSHRADDLVRHSPAFHQQPAQVCRLARQTLGEQAWEAKAARVWLPWE